MSEVIKIEELPDGGWLEHYSDGRIRAKNDEGKMMKHERNFTPPDAARKIGKKGIDIKLDQSSEIEEILEYLGLDGPYDFQMAKLMIGGKAGAVAASKELMKASTQRGNFKSTETARIRVEPGRVCPACRQYVLTDLILTDDQLDTIWDSIKVDDRFEYIESSPDNLEAEIARLSKLLADYQAKQTEFDVVEDSMPDIFQDTGGLEQ